MQYHMVKETYASAEFGSTPPLFPQTLLSSQTYVNITGGQRIHLSLQDSKPTVLSGLKAASQLVESDIFYRAGFVHVIDSVLTIPQSIAATVTGAKLTHLAALLNIGGWLSPDSSAKQILNDRSISLFSRRTIHDMVLLSPASMVCLKTHLQPYSSTLSFKSRRLYILPI